MSAERTVAIVSLGCARNDVDSEELAGRLAAAGWRLVDDAAEASVAVVNTCGFVEQAKKDSIDVLLEAAELRDDRETATRAVVAVGCLAERYGEQLAASLPEADAVLGFDSYPELARHLDDVLHGRPPAPHVPRDRRLLLPLAPADRAAARAAALPAAAPVPVGAAVAGVGPRAGVPAGHVQGQPLPAVLPSSTEPAGVPGTVLPFLAPLRARLDDRPWAPLKLASGCDRRCAFCAIPMFRGSFVSRRPDEVLGEARWLAGQGVRELFLVSENSTSYGKDLQQPRLLEELLPQLAAVDGVSRVRVSYLQPAEIRPGLIEVITGTPGVVPYFDISFQHSAPGLLRRMRRFGGTSDFLTLIDRVRELAPEAGIRSNVIVGFPGETEEDVAELEAFLNRARLDVVGVFGYSDEEGTEAAGLPGKLDADEIAARVARVSGLVDELVAQRAEDRVGERVHVLVEELDDGEPVGRAAHQGPEVDGVTRLRLPPAGPTVGVGDLVEAVVMATDGPDLIAEPVPGSGGRG